MACRRWPAVGKAFRQVARRQLGAEMRQQLDDVAADFVGECLEDRVGLARCGRPGRRIGTHARHPIKISTYANNVRPIGCSIRVRPRWPLGVAVRPPRTAAPKRQNRRSVLGECEQDSDPERTARRAVPVAPNARLGGSTRPGAGQAHPVASRSLGPAPRGGPGSRPKCAAARRHPRRWLLTAYRRWLQGRSGQR